MQMRGVPIAARFTPHFPPGSTCMILATSPFVDEAECVLYEGQLQCRRCVGCASHFAGSQDVFIGRRNHTLDGCGSQRCTSLYKSRDAVIVKQLAFLFLLI